MTATPHIPPTTRDFQIYERLIVEQATTRQAAEDFNLSQTRVRQIVHRVEEFLATALAASDSKDVDRGRLRLAQCVAAGRLHTLYEEALEQWNATHESKHFTIVLRLITAQAKLPAQPFTLAALAADALEDSLADESNGAPPPDELSPDELQAQPPAPPVEDCSTLTHPSVSATSTPPPDAEATSTPAITSAPTPTSPPRRNIARTSPAQTAPRAPSAIAELCLTPNEIVLKTRDLLLGKVGDSGPESPELLSEARFAAR